MKLVALWLVVVGFAAVTAGGCSVTHRSGDFACTTPADCADGRTCSEGFCVAPQLDSGVRTDAPSSGCPAQCTSCNTATKSCTIDCAVNPAACKQQVTCPAGWNCNIACSGISACTSGINCANSKSCTITCSGAQSCRNLNCGAAACNVDCAGSGSCRDFTCGTGACNVSCNNTDSCRNVSCGLSCACDIACRNPFCVGVTCKASQCQLQTPFGGCTSTPPGCNTCP